MIAQKGRQIRFEIRKTDITLARPLSRKVEKQKEKLKNKKGFLITKKPRFKKRPFVLETYIFIIGSDLFGFNV